jgi:hypothetical protein
MFHHLWLELTQKKILIIVPKVHWLVEDLEEIKEEHREEEEQYFEEHIITHIDNPSGRIKFKDIRKISIGVSKKDLIYFDFN